MTALSVAAWKGYTEIVEIILLHVLSFLDSQVFLFAIIEIVVFLYYLYYHWM